MATFWKDEYDKLAVEAFSDSEPLPITAGGALADVVQWRPSSREFFIIEVKSPCETDADINYRYKENYDLGGKSRRERWKIVERQGFAPPENGIARLITFTISNQLYTYYRRAGQHIRKFEQLTRQKIEPKSVRTFLVLPLEYERIAQKVIQCFPDARTMTTKRMSRIFVLEVSYPG